MAEPKQVPYRPPPRGLQNLGNTCFFNSTLQCLSSTAPLLEHFGLKDAKPGERELTVAFRRFMQGMAKECADGTAGKAMSPGELHAAVVRKAPRFRGYRQQDAQELLRFLLDGIDDEEMARWKELSAAKEKAMRAAAARQAAPAAVGAEGASDSQAAASSGDADTKDSTLDAAVAAAFNRSSGSAAQPDGHDDDTASGNAPASANGMDTGAATSAAPSSASAAASASAAPAPAPARPPPNIIARAFGGQLLSVITCDACGHVSTVADPCLDVSLPIPGGVPGQGGGDSGGNRGGGRKRRDSVDSGEYGGGGKGKGKGKKGGGGGAAAGGALGGPSKALKDMKAGARAAAAGKKAAAAAAAKPASSTTGKQPSAQELEVARLKRELGVKDAPAPGAAAAGGGDKKKKGATSAAVTSPSSLAIDPNLPPPAFLPACPPPLPAPSEVTSGDNKDKLAVIDWLRKHASDDILAQVRIPRTGKLTKAQLLTFTANVLGKRVKLVIESAQAHVAAAAASSTAAADSSDADGSAPASGATSDAEDAPPPPQQQPEVCDDRPTVDSGSTSAADVIVTASSDATSVAVPGGADKLTADASAADGSANDVSKAAIASSAASPTEPTDSRLTSADCAVDSNGIDPTAANSVSSTTDGVQEAISKLSLQPADNEAAAPEAAAAVDGLQTGVNTDASATSCVAVDGVTSASSEAPSPSASAETALLAPPPPPRQVQLRSGIGGSLLPHLGYWLPDPVPSSDVSTSSVTSLDACLSAFTAVEQLRVAAGNGYRCEKCAAAAKAAQAPAVPPAMEAATAATTSASEPVENNAAPALAAIDDHSPASSSGAAEPTPSLNGAPAVAQAEPTGHDEGSASNLKPADDGSSSAADTPAAATSDSAPAAADSESRPDGVGGKEAGEPAAAIGEDGADDCAAAQGDGDGSEADKEGEAEGEGEEGEENKSIPAGKRKGAAGGAASAAKKSSKDRKKEEEEERAQLRDATKRILLGPSLPPVLTLHLKRFANVGGGGRGGGGTHLAKISRHVPFPEVLDLTPYAAQKVEVAASPDVSGSGDGSSEGEGSSPPSSSTSASSSSSSIPAAAALPRILYRLSGVVVHSGGLSAGHYVAYVRHGRPQRFTADLGSSGDGSSNSILAPPVELLPPCGAEWSYISDSSVSTSDIRAVMGCEGYLLFYERVTPAA